MSDIISFSESKAKRQERLNQLINEQKEKLYRYEKMSDEPQTMKEALNLVQAMMDTTKNEDEIHRLNGMLNQTPNVPYTKISVAKFEADDAFN